MYSRLDFQCSTNVGERGGSKGQRLRMVLLPSRILTSKFKTFWMLKVSWQSDCFITRFTRDLNTQIPSVQRDKSECLGGTEDVFLDKGVDALDRFSKTSRILDMIPRQSCRARYTSKSAKHVEIGARGTHYTVK